MRQLSSEWGRVGLGFSITWGLIYAYIYISYAHVVGIKEFIDLFK